MSLNCDWPGCNFYAKNISPHPLPFTCPYASCIHCCIGHSNCALAGPDLVSGGGGSGCSCLLLLHPMPTFCGAGPDLCTLCWCCFPSVNRHKYSPCTHGGQHLLQLALVLFFHSAGTNTPLTHLVVITCCNLRWWCFFPATGALAPLALMQLALCGGGCMWYIHAINVHIHIHTRLEDLIRLG